MTTQLAVDTTGLTKEFAPGLGVVGLDLEVPGGCVYGFLGPNEAGKTTTLRMLIGSLVPDSGRARVLGLDPLVDAVQLKRRIGVLPSDATFPSHHTGVTLLRLLGRIHGDRPAIEARGCRLAERMAVELERPVRELSLGNRQKLGLVVALGHDPELLVLDEPSNGLDPLIQRELELLLREPAAGGRTALLVDLIRSRRRLVLGLLAGLAALTVMYLALFPSMQQQLEALAGEMPDAMRALIGDADLTTADGYLRSEVFALTAPLLVAALTIATGVVLPAPKPTRPSRRDLAL